MITILAKSFIIPNSEPSSGRIKPALKKSMLSPRLAVVSEAMAEIVSVEIRDEFTDKLSVLKKAWKP